MYEYTYTCLFQNPKDIAYVFSGYAPLSVRLVELLDKPNGPATFEEVSCGCQSSIDCVANYKVLPSLPSCLNKIRILVLMSMISVFSCVTWPLISEKCFYSWARKKK